MFSKEEELQHHQMLSVALGKGYRPPTESIIDTLTPATSIKHIKEANHNQRFTPEAADEKKSEAAAATLGLPVEKFKEIQAYTLTMRKKYPQMKAERIKRKVAEHFKIKLT
jgi:hypothetical protein